MKRTLVFDVRYRQPIEKVWEGISSREAVSLWMMQTNLVPKAGTPFKFFTKAERGFDGIINCEVTECDPPRKLVYAWNAPPVVGEVSWLLTSTADGGTRLHMEHSGFRGLFPGMLISLILQYAWNRELRWRLRRYLDGKQLVPPPSSHALPPG